MIEAVRAGAAEIAKSFNVVAMPPIASPPVSPLVDGA